MSTPAPKPRKRILSGVQPSGRLHLGNYFGAIKRHIEMQETAECYYFIADYHALTSVQDAAALREHTHDVALTYLALGLDAERTVFYRQSDVPEVCELTWLLETVTGMGLLEKGHSYKEKIARGITPSVGLFTYPALMAADILAPRADLVPVGKDQDQHVEMARDMAQAFNATFPAAEPVFHLPEALIGDAAARVPGTTFEKGPVLQVVTEVGLGGLEPETYAARFRELIGALEVELPAERLQTTTDFERAIARRHAEVFPESTVHSRTLRTVLEDPGRRVGVTPRSPGVAGLEFYVPISHTVFVTDEHGKRQAAKMSKSYGNTIEIFDSGKSLKKRVMGIETRLVDLADPLDHTEDLVIQLYALFASDAEFAEMRRNYERGGYGFGNAKKALLAKIEAHFAPFRDRRAELERDPDTVEDVLRDGARRAQCAARETLDRARAACGLGRSLLAAD